MKIRIAAATVLILVALYAPACHKNPQEVERPEKIVSLREVMYDSATYANLAHLWEKYYDAYPSEDAYANWVYAARYADFENIEAMLKKGVEKYPANPVLLYLAGMSKKGTHDNLEGRQLMERAVALDPGYIDPWFGLAVEYTIEGDRENTDVALRHLLNGGAVQDVIMDLSYNMLASLEPNAILLTNGDNDTFPGWILTRIVRFRPDVNIVNRSLLNVDSYVASIVKEGVPEFITQSGLDSLKTQVAESKANYKSGRIPPEEFAGVGDRLVVRVVNAGERAGRPVYFACTLGSSGLWKQIVSQARPLGLVSLVTRASSPYPVQIQKLFTVWTTEYRTGGLDSWQLHSSGKNSAGRILSKNYAAALHSLKTEILEARPDIQLLLFRWYRDHIVDLLDQNTVDEANRMWFNPGSPGEIREWSKSKGWPGD
jgi:hypothetical protein